MLKTQQAEFRELDIRVQSMASRIELQSSDLSVRLDGEPLAEGDVVQRTGAFRVDVGDEVTLLVSPGEGTGLSSLMADRQRCQRLLDSTTAAAS